MARYSFVGLRVLACWDICTLPSPHVHNMYIIAGAHAQLPYLTMLQWAGRPRPASGGSSSGVLGRGASPWCVAGVCGSVV